MSRQIWFEFGSEDEKEDEDMRSRRGRRGSMGSMLVMSTSRDQATGRLDSIRICPVGGEGR
jgi:hypothetical protein